ncbi:MAG: hypothetical protein AB7O28_07720 [Vicinamibacterales bacterium]
MLQDLATSSSTFLAVVSLLFFVVVYAVVALRVYLARPEDLAARARMALDEPEPVRGAGTDATTQG